MTFQVMSAPLPYSPADSPDSVARPPYWYRFDSSRPSYSEPYSRFRSYRSCSWLLDSMAFAAATIAAPQSFGGTCSGSHHSAPIAAVAGPSLLKSNTLPISWPSPCTCGGSQPASCAGRRPQREATDRPRLLRRAPARQPAAQRTAPSRRPWSGSRREGASLQGPAARQALRASHLSQRARGGPSSRTFCPLLTASILAEVVLHVLVLVGPVARHHRPLARHAGDGTFARQLLGRLGRWRGLV